MSEKAPILIPRGATTMLVLEQTSHLDWDWQNAFLSNVDGSKAFRPWYFKDFVQPANVIYTQVQELLRMSDDYTYATCEMAFLQKFAEKHPDRFEEIRRSERLSIVGGGITSPDSLLSNGECFLRNYVLGLKFLQDVSLAWSRCVWVPDDFGHDSQLPATLVAMDALAVGFARCPLAKEYLGNITDQQPEPAAGKILPKAPSEGGGCDFFWTAADGSKIFAHWMPARYSQGKTLYSGGTIGQLREPNVTCSPTPYVHIPVADDFYVPLGTLPDLIKQWTKDHPDQPAVLSTFDRYAESVLAYLELNPDTAVYTRSFHGDDRDPERTTFRSNPYWMGHYASRMNIKTLHQQATRMVLAAETLDAVLANLGRPLGDAPKRLLDTWAELVPSTHHDYINGTAQDNVTFEEQVPRLESSCSLARDLMNAQLQELSKALDLRFPLLLVFNPLGFDVRGTLVEFDNSGAASLSLPDGQSQATVDGKELVYVNAPSAGYRTFGSNDLPTPPPPAAVSTSDGGESYTLSNGRVSATIARGANWSLTNVTDSGNGKTVLSSGNTLSFYRDGGNIYEYGYECKGDGHFELLTPTITAGPAEITEKGPLRVTVRANIDVSLPGFVMQSYTLQYRLATGAPYLEMALMGEAPKGTSVFTAFTFGGPDTNVTGIVHGTPALWDHKSPATFGTQKFNSVIEATHDYLYVMVGADAAAVMYHQALPGWAISGKQVLASVLRNTPGDGCAGRGAAGNDSVPHTITYALRIPSDLEDIGAALQESRLYTTPLWATVAKPGGGSAPLELSLASVLSPPQAMLTAVKRGTLDPDSLFLRVYQPLNSPTTVELRTAPDATNATIVTALEQTPTSDMATSEEASRGGYRFTTARALTTVKIPHG